MRSLLLEFHRFNSLKSGIWREGDKYLVAAAARPVREYEMTMEQDDFLDLMLDLRYQGEADARMTALNKVGKLATQFLGTDSLTDIHDVKSGEFRFNSTSSSTLRSWRPCPSRRRPIARGGLFSRE